MSTKRIKSYLHMFRTFEADSGAYGWFPRLCSYGEGYDRADSIFVCEVEVDVDVPDNFDPREKQIAALEAQKKDAAAKYQALVTDLNRRISELQAITYETEAA